MGTPSLYMELMQMDNTEGKSHDTIPYMIVNLDYHDPVYIKKGYTRSTHS